MQKTSAPFPPITNVYTNKSLGGGGPKSETKQKKTRSKTKAAPAKPASKTAVSTKQLSKPPRSGLSPESLARHKQMVRYLHACVNPSIRGMVAHAALNPLPTNNAVPFYGEALLRVAVAANSTLYVCFPLGQTADYENANGSEMDGQSFHTSLIGFTNLPDANIVGSGVISTTLSNASTKPPAAMMYAVSAGLEVMPASFALTGNNAMLWDNNNLSAFPISADVRPATRRHLRQALISADIQFTNETPIGSRGGTFYTWEPMDTHAPIASSATTLEGSLIRELPTFRMWPCDERVHTWTLVGTKKTRSYCHDDAPGAEMPTIANLGLTVNNKNLPLNFMYLNSTTTAQTINVRLRTNWSVGGDGMVAIGRVVAPLGEAQQHATNALSAANAAGTVANVVKTAIGAVSDAGTRYDLASHVAALGAQAATYAANAVFGN